MIMSHYKAKRSCKGHSAARALLSGLLLVLTFVLLMPSGARAAEYDLENFIILVDDQVVIKGPADVVSGQGGFKINGDPRRSDIGSRNSIVLGGTMNTRIPIEAPAMPTTPPPLAKNINGVAAIAPKVSLGNFAKVSHIIYDQATGSFTSSGSSIAGPTLLENDMGNNSLNTTGFKDLPDFPLFPTIPNLDAALDVIVAQNTTVNLPPGSYRDLILGAKATVNFVTGTYNFRRITANSPSSYKLVMQDDVRIQVKQFVRLAEFGNVNPTLAKGVTIYVEGADGVGGSANRNLKGVVRAGLALPAAFEYDGDGLFVVCFVFAKNGTMNLRGHSYPNAAATQWFGNSFQMISTIRITIEHPGEVCYEYPPIACSCANDIKLNKSSGILTVNGLNFSSKSVRGLAFFDVAAVAAMSDPLPSATLFLPLSVAPNGITILSPDTLVTNSSIKAPTLAPGKYYIGIPYPIHSNTGNPGGYCIYTDEQLDITP